MAEKTMTSLRTMKILAAKVESQLEITATLLKQLESEIIAYELEQPDEA